ncbi:MAG: hypothetical protein JO292_04435 [Betaproteobacteria bacterium]|nr:hypothetical protein [Betaproteobacteria bacterium]MBV9360617.1 hypothetical protein [Betaproteobacteria bacterium]
MQARRAGAEPSARKLPFDIWQAGLKRRQVAFRAENDAERAQFRCQRIASIEMKNDFQMRKIGSVPIS